MKVSMKKTISFLMALVMLLGLVPSTTVLAVETKDSGTANFDVSDDTIFSSAKAPEGYIPQSSGERVPMPNAQAAVGDEALPKVLLIQDVLPWNSTANQDVLEKITEYDVTTTTEFLNVELEEYGVVVFANDQPFATYQNYEAFKEYLELFASLGGVIVFGACDAGWADGELNEMLPGDVSKKTHYVHENYVADASHLITTGALTDNVALADSDLIGYYCSHVSFDEASLPAGSKIILREKDSNRPTLVEYPLGDGRVIASGLTWEYGYVRAGTNVEGVVIGNYAVRAMEDMFRYAIRVSNIDVDELHVLEEWRTAKKAHAIVVADKSGSKDNLNPIAGAKVFIDGTEYITNEDGIVVTTDYGERTVEVIAEGYRDYKEFYKLEEETSRIFLMEKDKNDGLPYITLCTAAKNGKAPYVDLRNQALHYTENKGTMLILWLQGNWNGHGEGMFRVYQEAANGKPGKVFEIPAGNYLNIAPGNVFEPNAQIKVQMVAADGTKSEIVELNIEIDKAPPEPGEISDTTIREGVTKFDWLGSFPIASDNEVFTKLLTTDMSIKGDAIPLEIAVVHNEDGTVTYKGLLGWKSGEYSKSLLNDKANEKSEFGSAWDDFKKEVKNYKKAGNPEQYFSNLKKKYGKQWHPTRLRASFEANIDICGFIEVTTDCNGDIIKSDGGMIINADTGYVIGKTYAWPPIPCPVYFEFKPGVEAEASIGFNFYNENDGLNFKLVFNGLELALPRISLEGGIGVRGVATGGIKGTGKLMVAFPDTEDSNFNVDLTLDGSLHAKVVLIGEWNWSFASTKIHFYPKEKAANVLAAAMAEVEPELTLASRDYLANGTGWNGAVTALMADDNTEIPTVLQMGVMPEAMPQIHQIGDKQVLLFLRDLGERTIGNHTQLVYSVCENGIWSEPQPVWESDTADFFFSSAAVNDKLVVAWQKSSEMSVSDNAEDLLAEVAKNAEICVASWDAETGAFTNQMYVTDNDLVDMMPTVAMDGENISVSWVRNDANNLVGTDGNYQIYQTAITADGYQPEKLLYSTEDYVVEIASGMDDEGVHLIFASMNESGTVDLYGFSGNETNKLVSSGNPAGLSYADGMFLWQEDGSIYSYVPGAAKVNVLIGSETAAVSSSYEYVTNGTEAAVVWTDMNENGYQVNASIRANNSWTTPVMLMGGDEDTVPFMDAALLENGNYSVILNTVCYDEEENVDQTTLSYVNVTPKTNVSVELAELNYPDWKNGTQEINVALENNGSVPAYNATVSISCENGTILNKNVDMELMPGDSVIITEVLDIQSINQEMEGVVSVQIANDIDESDNTMTVKLGEVDASLHLDVYENGDEFLFVLTASNNSYTNANAALSIMEDNLDGVVLNMKNIGVVTNAENVQYLFKIDRSKVDFAEKEYKTYFFSLSTLESDWYDSDNVLTYTIKAPNTIVTDPDGEMEIIEMILPERVEITEDDLHFTSLEDESVQLHAVVYPEEASDRAVYWSAEDNNIVHITEDGLVTPLREGRTTITAMVTDDITDTIVVTVVAHADCPSASFTDVYLNAWYHEAVDFAIDQGLMIGTSKTTFEPGSNVTRGQLVTVLHRMAGTPIAYGTGFTDVEDGMWYTDAILWAQANDIVNGYGDGTFRPNEYMTREEMVAVIYRYAQYNGYDVSASAMMQCYHDSVTIQAYAQDAMSWAVSVGLIKGFPDGTIRPKGISTRVQLATVLMRFSNYFG